MKLIQWELRKKTCLEFYKLREEHPLLPLPIISFAPAHTKPRRWVISTMYKHQNFFWGWNFLGRVGKKIVCKMFYQTLAKGCQHLVTNLLGQVLPSDSDFYLGKD